MWSSRTSGDLSALSAALRTLIREADKTAFIYRIAPLADLRSDSVAKPRFSMIVLVAFATVAVLLTIVGLYVSHRPTTFRSARLSTCYVPLWAPTG